MNIGDLIKRYLEENDISAMDFARKCGYSTSTIYRFISGKNAFGNPLSKPTMETISKVAKGLGCDPKDLFIMVNGDDSIDMLLTDEEKEVMEAYRHAPKILQDGIKDMLHIKTKAMG